MLFILIAAIIALLVLVLLVIALATQEPGPGFAALGVLFLLALFSGWNSYYQVPAGHVGIVYAFGDIVDQTGTGAQWVAPWRRVWPATAQLQKLTFKGDNHLSSFSAETQDVFVDATVNVRVLPEKIQDLYRTVGEDYIEVIVKPRIRQAFKDETVKYAAVDIAPHREDIRHSVSARVSTELAARSIIVEDLLVDNLAFSKDFQASIERKQVASQDALAERERIAGERNKAQQKIEEARGTAESILVNATKQAEANNLLSRSITPELVQYQMVTKLAPTISTIMLPAGAPFMLPSTLIGGAR